MGHTSADADRAVFSGAEQLAAQGEFAGALCLLDVLADALTPETHILRGKIAAQQGDRALALSAFELARESAPDDERVLAALHRLRGEGELAPHSATRLWWLLLALLAFVGLGRVVAPHLGRATSRGSEARTLAARPSASVAQSSPAPCSTPPEGSQPTAESGSIAPRRQLPRIDLNLPGVALEAADGAVVIRFREGLFEPGATRVRPLALETLRTVGRALAQVGGRIAITVEGRTDDVPVRSSRYRDNATLGWLRAVSVADELRQSSGFAPSAFRVQGWDGPAHRQAGDAERAVARNALVRLESLD